MNHIYIYDSYFIYDLNATKIKKREQKESGEKL